MNKFRMMCAALITAALLTSYPVIRVHAGGGDNPAPVSKLFSQAKTQAYQLRDDTAQMELYALVHESASSATQISVETYADATHAVNGDVNGMMVLLAKLDSTEKTATPWCSREQSMRSGLS